MTPVRTFRTTVTAVAVVALLAAVIGGCSGEDVADGGADRQAGAITRGTEVCIRNASSADLRIEVLGSGPTHPNVGSSTGLGPNVTRCMDSDSYTAAGSAYARVTIASGEQFTVQGFNPPFDPPWIAVNGDSRELAVGGTTNFKIGIHPIVATRAGDTTSSVRFEMVIS